MFTISHVLNRINKVFLYVIPLIIISCKHVQKEDFFCHIKYLDAVFMQIPPNDCNNPTPVLTVWGTDTVYAHQNTDISRVILYLDKTSGYKSKFEIALGSAGAYITNYSDSLYSLERENWIRSFNARKI